MLIKMLTLQAGPEGTREPGKTYDVPDKEAADLIKGGYALEVNRNGSSARKATGKRGQEQTNEKPVSPAFQPVTVKKSKGTDEDNQSDGSDEDSKG